MQREKLTKRTKPTKPTELTKPTKLTKLTKTLLKGIKIVGEPGPIFFSNYARVNIKADEGLIAFNVGLAKYEGPEDNKYELGREVCRIYMTRTHLISLRDAITNTLKAFEKEPEEK